MPRNCTEIEPGLRSTDQTLNRNKDKPKGLLNKFSTFRERLVIETTTHIKPYRWWKMHHLDKPTRILVDGWLDWRKDHTIE